MMLPRPLTLILLPLLTVFSINLKGQVCNANFTTSTPGNCNTVSFTPAATDNGLSFEWSFGDGEVSTERAPDHTYFVDAPGSYNFNVTLIVGGNCVQDTVSRNVNVSVGSLPDPSISSVNVLDFINCFATNDNPVFDLEINNISSTAGSNASYTIDWGDGSPPETVNNLPNGTTHRYDQVGLFNLVLIVRGNNGCAARRIYEVYNGNNPGGNVSSTSNTIACIPETVGFPIRDTENNVSGTIYRLWVNDGLSDTIVYQHPPPGVFTYEFLSSACDSNHIDLNGRFTISFEAQNPCFTQPGATTVIVNRPPVGDFTIDDDVQCAESIFTFTNTSTPGNYFQQNAGCSGEMRTNWSISPNSGYQLVTGDLQTEEGFSARFDEPGNYDITMIYRSRFSSGCDPDTVIKTICVLPIPESSFTVDQMSGCAAFTIETTNTSNTLNSCREGTEYTWIMRYDPGECATGPAFEYVNMTDENDVNVEIQFDSAGIYELGLIVSNECLPPDTSFQTIVVSSRPITTLAMIPDTCFTGPITIETNITSTTGCSDDPNYTWDFPGADQTSGSGSNPGPRTYSSPGVYTITLNTSNDCGNRNTTQTFEIFAPPTVPNITLNSPICIGTTARFINPSPGNFIYSWTGPAGFTSSVPAPEIADVTSAQSGTYELTITDPQTGCTNTRSFPLQVTTTAPLTVTPNPANICIGESVVLTVSGPSTVTWSPGDHLSSTMGTSVTVSPPAVGTYEYIVEGTDPNESCNGLDTVVVIVNPLPIVEAGERRVACVDTDFQLKGSPANGEGGTGTWSGPNIVADGTFNSSDSGVFTVGYRFVDDNGCEAVDSTEVCVIPDPVASFSLDNTTGCLNLEVTVTNTSNTIGGCEAAMYEWSASLVDAECHENDGGVQFVQGTDATSENAVFRFPQSGTYEISLTVINDCNTVTVTEQVTVGETPQVSLDPIDDACGNASIRPTFTALNCNSTITTYEWEFVGGNPSAFSGMNPPAVSYDTPDCYTVKLTVTNDCGSDIDMIEFCVLEGPTLDAGLIADFVCQGGTISAINNSQGDNLTYQWSASSNQIGISAETSATPIFSFAGVPQGDYQITLEIGNAACAGLTEQFDIRVIEDPSVEMNPIENFCESARITPSATFSDEDFIDSVRWTFPPEADILTSDQLSPGDININEPGDYTFSVTVYNACEEQTSSQSFRVLEGPNLDISLDTAFVCVGSGTISVMNNSSGDDLAYTWTESSGGQIQISDESAASPTFSFADTPIGDYQITVNVANPVCDGLTQTFDIRVSETPTVTLAAIDNFCETARVRPVPTYSNEDFIDSVRWIFPAAANIQTLDVLDPGEIEINQAGDYTIQVTVYNACGQNNAQQSFRVLEGPNLDISLDTTFVCAGSGMINVINNSTGDDLAYNWAESSNGQIQISDANAARPTFSFVNTPIGDYQLTVTVGNPVCDGLTQTFDIRVSESPTVTLVAIEDFCETARVLPAPTYSNEDFIDSVRWTFPAEANVQTSTALDPGEIAIDQPGDYTFSVTVYNACGQNNAQQSFRVLEGPNLDISLDTAFVCSGSGIIMAINNSTGDDLSYTWEESSNGQIQISDATSATPTFSFANTPIGDYQLTVTVVNPVCDGLTQTFDIRVSETPSVTLAAIEDFCETAQIIPIPTYSDEDFIDSVRWTFPAEANIQTSTILNPDEITIDEPGDYTFSVTVYNACGADTAEQPFRILEGPNLDIQLDTAFVCAGSGTIMAINNSTGDDLSYTWEESSNGQIQISDVTSATPTFSFANTPIGDYQLTVMVVNPVCDGLTQTFDIRVSETPSVTLAAIEDFCETATIAPVPTYSDQDFIDSVRWIFPAEADIQTSTDFNPGQITINQPGNYTFFLTVYNSCGQDTASQAFRILEGPNLDIALDTAFVCAGSGRINVINNSTGDDLSYTWEESSGGQIQISDENADTPTFNFASTPIGDYQIAVTVTNPVCEGLTQTFNIRVSETPSVTLEAIEDFCETALIQPIVAYSNEDFIDSVRWIFPAEAAIQTSVALDPGEIAINQPGDYTFSVTVYNACGEDTAEQFFRILEGPNLDISLDTTFACTGVDRIEVINNSTGDDLSYVWEESSGGLIQISDASIADPIFSFENTPIGVYQLTVTVSNPVCEALTQSFNIRISDSPEVAFEEIEDFCETAAIQVVPSYSDTSFIDSVRWVFPAEADVTSSADLFPGIVSINESGSYSVVVTVYNECGQFSAERTFQIFEGPSLAITLDSTFACRGDVITIGNGSTGDSLSYQWRATGPGQVEISDPTAIAPSLTFPDTGIYIIEAEISNPVCEPIFWQDTVLVSELPVTDLTAISDYCGEALIRPNPTYGDASRIDSVRWLFPGGFPLSSSDLFPDEVFYDTAGIYTITLLAYNRCGVDSSSQSFAVLAPIEVDAVLSSDFSCDLPHTISVENLTKGDSLNFEWSVSGPFAQNVEFASQLVEPTFVFQDTGQYIITQRVFNEICGELSWQDTVTLLAVPQPALAGVDRFCEEVTLTPTVDYFEYRLDSVRWDFPGGSPATSSDLNPADILYVGAGTYIYTLTAYNECGNTVVRDTFIVDTIPVIDLGPADTICITDGPFQLPNASPLGGIWLDSLRRPGVVTEGGLFNPVIAMGGSTTVEYLYTVGVCEVSTYKTVLVIDLSYVDGGPDVDACVSDSLIRLSGGTPAGGWYEGPGITDSVGFFSPASLGEGCYTLTYFYQLEGTDCVQGDDFTVCVRPLPVPEINVTDSICVNVPVPLFSVGSGEVAYEWLINDSLLYTTANPSHAFSDTGFQTVKLISISEFGCRDSISREVYVSGPPIAFFELDTLMGCAVLPVNATNLSLGYEFVSYTWDFGDGFQSNEEQPGTIFYDQGLQDTTYYISLLAQNHCGQSLHEDSVIVFPKPIARIDLSQERGCTPLAVEFNNFSQGLPDSFIWDLGIPGGIYTDSIPPDQSYLAPDSNNVFYDIQFIAINECGQDTVSRVIEVLPDDIRAFFSVDQQVGCEPFDVEFFNSTAPDTLINYDWFFGDGETDNVKNPMHTFFPQGDSSTTYTSVLIADNGCGRDSIAIPITVHPAPEVSFTVPPVNCARDSVPFTNTSLDVTGSVWSFGDGDTLLATNPTHFYQGEGTYQVDLTAFAVGTGCPNTYTDFVEIRPIPTASLTASPVFGCPPLQVSVNNASTDASYFTWDYGDGNTDVGNPTQHTYTESGFYDIRLTATDDFGCSDDTVFSTIQVYPVPDVAFESFADKPCGTPVEVCLENMTVGAQGFDWDFGNGMTSTENSPCIMYNEPGAYSVQLIAQNEFLCTETLVDTVIVYGVPEASFELPIPPFCQGTQIVLDNTSSFADYAEWTLTGGFFSTEWSPTITLEELGDLGIQLIVGNGSGCSDTTENQLEVFPSPTARFTFVELAAQVPDVLPTSIQFIDKSSADAILFDWDFGDGNTSQEENPVHRYLSSYDKLVTHWVANMYGCTDTATALVDLDTLGGLYIPNALEPDAPSGSGKNTFLPRGIGLSEFHIAIYARTGQLIWESTSIDDEGMPDEAWDGTFRGQDLPPDTYTWKVHLARYLDGSYWQGAPDRRGKLRKTGFVYLIK